MKRATCKECRFLGLPYALTGQGEAAVELRRDRSVHGMNVQRIIRCQTGAAGAVPPQRHCEPPRRRIQGGCGARLEYTVRRTVLETFRTFILRERVHDARRNDCRHPFDHRP
jgi:hypothetical protein